MELTEMKTPKFHTARGQDITNIDYPALLDELADMLYGAVGQIAIVSKVLNSEDFEDIVVSKQTSPTFEELNMCQKFAEEAAAAVGKVRNVILLNT